MNIKWKDESGCLVVSVLAEKLDFTNCPEIKTEILNLIAGQSARCVILDLSGVSFMDSMAIGAMVAINKSIAGQFGKMALCCLHPYVQKILSVVTVNTIFTVFETKEAALKALKEAVSG